MKSTTHIPVKLLAQIGDSEPLVIGEANMDVYFEQVSKTDYAIGMSTNDTLERIRRAAEAFNAATEELFIPATSGHRNQKIWAEASERLLQMEEEPPGTFNACTCGNAEVCSNCPR